MTEREKMLAGLPYDAADRDLVKARERSARLCMGFNTWPDAGERQKLIRKLFGQADKTTVIVPTFYCDYGANIRVGKRAFVNANCVFLDCAEITIGDNFQCGPGVQLLTPEHPLDAMDRRSLETARPIVIGDDVWIGGGAIVLAGVTVGDRSVIGAGAVVTKDVPSDVVVVGNPARVVKRLA